LYERHENCLLQGVARCNTTALADATKALYFEFKALVRGTDEFYSVEDAVFDFKDENTEKKLGRRYTKAESYWMSELLDAT
jgi:hypothetical protein